MQAGGAASSKPEAHKVPYLPIDGGQPESRVVITISARDLRDTDINSVSDPFCVLLEAQFNGRVRHWKEIGRTEVVQNCLYPDWCTKLKMTYHYNQDQRLRFEVYDKGPVGKDTPLGNATVHLHEIVNSKFNRVTCPIIHDGKHQGDLTVAAEELSEGRQESVYFVCSATKLDRKDFLGKCDPFLKISRINYDNTLQLAYRTRYKEQNLNPKWKPFEIHIDQLCYGDKNRAFLVECFDWDQDGNHDLVGACTTTVNRLTTQQDLSLQLVHEKKQRKSKKYVDSGILHFQKVYCWMDHSFEDFITGGTQLEFSIAVGFPSNWDEDPRQPHSSDQLLLAIKSIAEICQTFNPSQVFDAYGFGARVPNMDRSTGIFALNVDTGNTKCDGVTGIINAYQMARKYVHLGGPANFASTIRLAAAKASQAPADGSKYNVLIIFTDGSISDMEKTKMEVVKASLLPLSIIIVGIGYDCFEEMKTLDSDNVMLSWNGKSAKRDIVQFVQLRAFLPPHRRLNPDEEFEAKRLLAKEMMQELPLQLTSYMKSKGIAPIYPVVQQYKPMPPPLMPMSSRSSLGSLDPMTPRSSRQSISSEPGTRSRRQLPQVPIDETFKLRI